MNYETLLNGYDKVLHSIYSPRQHYERIKVFLKEYRPRRKWAFRPHSYVFTGFIKLIWVLGIRNRGRRYFWGLLFSTLFKHPHFFGISMTLAGYGFHFRKVTEGYSTLLAVRSKVTE